MHSLRYNVGNTAGGEPIIRVQEYNIIGTSQRQPAISRSRSTAIGAGFPADAVAEGADHVEAAVGRSVVDDDDLQRPMVLPAVMYLGGLGFIGVGAGALLDRKPKRKAPVKRKRRTTRKPRKPPAPAVKGVVVPFTR